MIVAMAMNIRHGYGHRHGHGLLVADTQHILEGAEMHVLGSRSGYWADLETEVRADQSRAMHGSGSIH